MAVSTELTVWGSEDANGGYDGGPGEAEGMRDRR